MTSLYSSIVHHLSGLNHNALTHATDRSQSKVGTVNAYLEFSFNTPISLPLVDSHCSKTPWSVFQDGSVKVVLTRSILSPRLHFLYSWSAELILSFPKPSVPLQAAFASQDHKNFTKDLLQRDYPTSIASFSTVSSLLTLFPKFFSSFPHGTCLLSVSHSYLALEEVYLPI